MMRILTYLQGLWVKLLRFVKRWTLGSMPFKDVSGWIMEFYYFSDKVPVAMTGRRTPVNEAVLQKVRASQLFNSTGIAKRLPEVSRHIKGDLWNNSGFLAVGEVTLPFTQAWRVVDVGTFDYVFRADLIPPEYPLGVADANDPLGTIVVSLDGKELDNSEFEAEIVATGTDNYLEIRAAPGFLFVTGLWRVRILEGNTYLRPDVSTKLFISGSPVIIESFPAVYQDGPEQGWVVDLAGGPNPLPAPGTQIFLWVRPQVNTLEYDLPYIEIEVFDTPETVAAKAVAAWNGTSIYGLPALTVYLDPGDPTRIRITPNQFVSVNEARIYTTPPPIPPLTLGPKPLRISSFAYTLNFFFVIQIEDGPEQIPQTITSNWSPAAGGYAPFQLQYQTQILQTNAQAIAGIIAAWHDHPVGGGVRVSAIPHPDGRGDKVILGTVNATTGSIIVTVT